MNTLRLTMHAALLLTLLAGCAAKEDKTRLYYRLGETAYPKAEHRQSLPLYIERAQAAGILGNRPFVATGQDGALRQLNRHFWLDSPKKLLQQYLQDWARQSGLWPEVLAQPEARAHQRLKVELLRFEKNADRAEVAIQFTLLDANHAVMFNQTFSDTQPIQGQTYAEFVAAISKALHQTVLQFQQQMP